MSSYDHYVKDDAFLTTYNEYQKRYATQVPERDKVILRIIAKAMGGRAGALLDIGCSTGNLILHAKRLFSNIQFVGGELAESSLKEARGNPDLEGVRFEVMDMLDLRGTYDVIVANAVAVYFGYDEYEAAMRSIAKALKPGGTYIAFEWLHPFADQDLTIIEKSVTHPEGLKIHFRPIAKVKAILESCGFSSIAFEPFEIPIDLPFPGYTGDVATYTRTTDDGARLQFRGTLFQPWCHLSAEKRG